MPKVIDVTGVDTPVSVEAATRAFGSALRVHLIRYYLASPGPQYQAASALGVSRRAVAINTKLLHELGVLVEEPSPNDGRSVIYRVDAARVAHLEAALHAFVSGT